MGTVLQSKRAIFCVTSPISRLARKKFYFALVDNSMETIQMQPQFYQNLQKSVINVEITLELGFLIWGILNSMHSTRILNVNS